MTPGLRISDGKFVHAIHEFRPAELVPPRSKQRIDPRLRRIARGAVVIHEPHENLVLAGIVRRRNIARGVGEEFKSHTARVVRNTGEIDVNLIQTGKAEERHERRVGAELDADFASRQTARVFDDGGQELCDFGRELGAGDGADGRGAVVGEVPFVIVSQRAEL